MKNQKSPARNRYAQSVAGGNIKNILAITVASLAILGFVAYGTVRAYADDKSGGYPSIIQKLVERFGLNEEEVKTVFDEARGERQQQMQDRFEERLNQAVSDGKITEEQKQAILAKKAEMQVNRGEFKDFSPEERQEKMQAHREEMQTWAEANGIDISQIHSLLGKGCRSGFGRPMFDK